MSLVEVLGVTFSLCAATSIGQFAGQLCNHTAAGRFQICLHFGQATQQAPLTEARVRAVFLQVCVANRERGADGKEQAIDHIANIIERVSAGPADFGFMRIKARQYPPIAWFYG